MFSHRNSRRYLLLLTDILPKTVVGCPCIKHYFPTPNQQPEKTVVLLAPSEEPGTAVFAGYQINCYLKKSLKTYVFSFPGKDETHEQTNFLDKLSVGDQFINKSQNEMVIHLIFSVQPFSC